MKKWSNCLQFLRKIDNASSNFLHFPIDLVATSLCGSLGSIFPVWELPDSLPSWQSGQLSPSSPSLCPHSWGLNTDFPQLTYPEHSTSGSFLCVPLFPKYQIMRVLLFCITFLCLPFYFCYLKAMYNARKLRTTHGFNLWYWHLLCNFMSDIALLKKIIYKLNAPLIA